MASGRQDLRLQVLAAISQYRRYTKHARKVAATARLVDRRVAAKARAEAYEGVVLNLESLVGSVRKRSGSGRW